MQVPNTRLVMSNALCGYRAECAILVVMLNLWSDAGSITIGNIWRQKSYLCKCSKSAFGASNGAWCDRLSGDMTAG